MPTFFILFIIFIIWFQYEKRKNTKIVEQEERSFWLREEASNNARKKDISELPYITIPDNAFDDIFGASSDDDILALEQSLRNMSHAKMIDLSEYSNTDLKIYFGVGNFGDLSSYDQNYQNFLNELTSYGKALLAHQHPHHALAAFSLCLTLGSDRSIDYISMGRCYRDLDRPEDIVELINSVKESDLQFKNCIVSELAEVLSSYGVES